MSGTQHISQHRSSLLTSEDWWAVWLGLFIFLLGAGKVGGLDILGWVAKFGIWTDVTKAVVPNSPAFAWLGGIGSLVATYLFLVIITFIGAYFMKAPVKRFAAGFTCIYAITVIMNGLGNYAYLAATPDKRAAFSIPWSLSLGELGFVFALVAGLIIGNFFPKATQFLSTAAKPEWYIKTGIVILGANIGIQAISAMNLASTVIVRGLCAVVEAYLIYWPVVYIIARKFFISRQNGRLPWRRAFPFVALRPPLLQAVPSGPVKLFRLSWHRSSSSSLHLNCSCYLLRLLIS